MKSLLLASLVLALVASSLGCHKAEVPDEAYMAANPGITLTANKDFTGSCGWISTTQDKVGHFGSIWRGGDWPANNDCARAFIIRNVKANTLIAFFDRKDRNTRDDWMYIWTKRDITEKKVTTFEQTRDDADVVIVTGLVDNLDGKVSAATVRLNTPRPDPATFKQTK